MPISTEEYTILGVIRTCVAVYCAILGNNVYSILVFRAVIFNDKKFSTTFFDSKYIVRTSVADYGAIGPSSDSIIVIRAGIVDYYAVESSNDTIALPHSVISIIGTGIVLDCVVIAVISSTLEVDTMFFIVGASVVCYCVFI